LRLYPSSALPSAAQPRQHFRPLLRPRLIAALLWAMLYSVTKSQSAIRDLFKREARSRGQSAASARSVPRSDGPDRPHRRRWRARACDRALGNERAAAIWRPARDQHPQRRKPALARLARQAQSSIVPAISFCEYADTKPRKTPMWFALSEDRPLFAFAGLWTPWRGVRWPKSAPIEGDHELFGFLTTEANAIVAPVHPKAMPVILTTPDEVDLWLTAETAEALALQRPLPDEALRIVAKGEREDPAPPVTTKAPAS